MLTFWNCTCSVVHPIIFMLRDHTSTTSKYQKFLGLICPFALFFWETQKAHSPLEASNPLGMN